MVVGKQLCLSWRSGDNLPPNTSIHLDTDNPVYGHSATHICLEDESGGAFIVLKQYNDQNEPGELRFDLKELELIARVAKEMVDEYNKIDAL